MNHNELKTLKEWAYVSMPPEKAEKFLDYFKGCIYRIGEDHKPYRVGDNDGIPARDFNAYRDDFERWITHTY